MMGMGAESFGRGVLLGFRFLPGGLGAGVDGRGRHSCKHSCRENKQHMYKDHKKEARRSLERRQIAVLSADSQSAMAVPASASLVPGHDVTPRRTDARCGSDSPARSS